MYISKLHIYIHSINLLYIYILIYWCRSVYNRSSCIDKLWRHLHVTISVQVSMRWSCPFGVIKGCDDFKLHYRRFHGRQLKVCLFGAKNVSNHGKKLNVFFTNLQAISGLLGLLMYEGDSFGDFFLKMTEFLISKLNFRDVKHTSSKPSGTHLLTALCFPKTKDETKNYKKNPPLRSFSTSSSVIFFQFPRCFCRWNSYPQQHLGSWWLQPTSQGVRDIWNQQLAGRYSVGPVSECM